MATNNKVAQDFKQVDNDLYINPNTGDFMIAPSDNQHIEDILSSEPGWWKEFVLVGASLRRLLKAKFNTQTVESTIKQQLEADGYQAGRPQISINANGNATIRPNATRVKF